MQPRFDRKVRVPAVVIDRNAFHVLHHQIRQPFDAHPAVQQSRNVRMIQPGQDLPLGAESQQHLTIPAEVGAHQLDRDLLIVNFVRPAREVNPAHAALAQRLKNLPRSDPPARETNLACDLARRPFRRFPERAECLIGRIQQRFHLSPHLRITDTRLIQKLRPIPRIHIGSLIKQRFQPPPSLGIGLERRAHRTLSGASAGEVPVQPGLRHLQFAVHRRLRNSQSRAGLFVSQTAEKQQLNDLALSRIAHFEPSQRFVQIGQTGRRGRTHHHGLIKRNMRRAASAFPPARSLRVIHQNIPHYPRRHGEEMCPVLPVSVRPCQPQIGFVNQRRGPQRLFRTPGAQTSARNLPQLIVNNGNQVIERVLIAAAQSAEQHRHRGSVHRRGIGLQTWLRTHSLEFYTAARQSIDIESR